MTILEKCAQCTLTYGVSGFYPPDDREVYEVNELESVTSEEWAEFKVYDRRWSYLCNYCILDGLARMREGEDNRWNQGPPGHMECCEKCQVPTFDSIYRIIDGKEARLPFCDLCANKEING